MISSACRSVLVKTSASSSAKWATSVFVVMSTRIVALLAPGSARGCDGDERRRVEALGEVGEDMALGGEAVEVRDARRVEGDAQVVLREHVGREGELVAGGRGGVGVKEDGARVREKARAGGAERVAVGGEAVGGVVAAPPVVEDAAPSLSEVPQAARPAENENNAMVKALRIAAVRLGMAAAFRGASAASAEAAGNGPTMWCISIVTSAPAVASTSRSAASSSTTSRTEARSAWRRPEPPPAAPARASAARRGTAKPPRNPPCRPRRRPSGRAARRDRRGAAPRARSSLDATRADPGVDLKAASIAASSSALAMRGQSPAPPPSAAASSPPRGGAPPWCRGRRASRSAS